MWCSVPWEVHGCGGVVVVVMTGGEGREWGREWRRRKDRKDRARNKEAQHEWAERARKCKDYKSALGFLWSSMLLPVLQSSDAA